MNPYRRRRVREDLRRPRDLFSIATSLVRQSPVSLLSVYSDRRLYDPTALTRAPFAFRPSASRLVARSAPARSKALVSPRMAREVIAFAEPKLVAICKRRKSRRQVLLAMGKGGARHRRPRRNAWSDVAC